MNLAHWDCRIRPHSGVAGKDLLCFIALLFAPFAPHFAYTLPNMKMWGRFQELQKFETAKSGSAKTSKRKSVDGKELKVPKRKRKSLFTTFPRHHERTSQVEAARGPNNDQIDEFSSDEELPENTAVFHDENETKKVKEYQSLQGEKARRKSAPLYLPKVSNDNEQMQEQVINWSDSDNEEISSTAGGNAADTGNNEQSIRWKSDIHNATTTCPSDKVHINVNDIEMFESPAKNVSQPEDIAAQPDSQVVIEESSPTPKSNESHEVRIKDENADDYVPRPIDSTKKKRSKDLKGGLTEHLKKLSARERSDLVFWRHTAEKGGLKVENDGDTGGEILPLQVLSMKKDFSLSILRCDTLEANPKTVYVIFPQEIDKELKISENCLLEIHPPWKKVYVPGLEGILLLSAYLLKTTTVIPTDGFAVTSRYDCLSCNTIEYPKSSPHDLGDIPTAKERQGIHETSTTRGSELSEIFDCSNFSGLCSFLGILIKANLVSKPTIPAFLGHSNERILDQVKQFFCDKDNETFDIELIIKDKNDKIAIVRVPVSSIDPQLSEKVFGSNGTKLAFTNFQLKDVKNMVFDEPFLTILANTDLKSSQVTSCYVFSHTEKSNVTEEPQIKPAVVNTMQCTEEGNTSVKETQNSYFKRVSMYVKCICMLPKAGNKSLDANQSHFLMYVFKIPDETKTANNTIMNNASPAYLTEKLPNCYVPKSVIKSLMQSNTVLYLHDLVHDLRRQYFVADKYTRICIVSEPDAIEGGSGQSGLNDCYSKHIVAKQKAAELLSRQPNLLENISEECKEKDLVKVEGTIVGLDEENAMFWAICSDCGLESDNAMEESTFFCKNCNTIVKRTIHVQLEVYLGSKTLSNVIISVKLLEKTVFDYLPMEISSEFRGYDTACIIGRMFGPKLCYCVQRKQESDTNTSKPMVHLKLLEVQIAEGLKHLLC